MTKIKSFQALHCSLFRIEESAFTLMKFYFLIVFSLVSINALAQSQEALSVEELLEKNRPNEFRARQNNEKYLVLQKANGKRRRYFIGDVIRFKTEQELIFQEAVTDVNDGYFKIIYFDETTSRPEERTIYLNEVTMLYKRQKKKGLNLGIVTGAFFLPLVYDWIQFGIEPWKNNDSYGTMAIVGGAGILLANKNKFFNRMKIDENKWELKVFQF